MGLMVAALTLIITLAVGAISYRSGVTAGKQDAAHDSWNNGFRDAADQCIKSYNGGQNYVPGLSPHVTVGVGK